MRAMFLSHRATAAPVLKRCTPIRHHAEEPGRHHADAPAWRLTTTPRSRGATVPRSRGATVPMHRTATMPRHRGTTMPRSHGAGGAPATWSGDADHAGQNLACPHAMTRTNAHAGAAGPMNPACRRAGRKPTHQERRPRRRGRCGNTKPASYDLRLHRSPPPTRKPARLLACEWR